jgi:hypothetical protein
MTAVAAPANAGTKQNMTAAIFGTEAFRAVIRIRVTA